jgi:DNA helicase-2/ATP-dependent DNA helicase PcrA
VEPSDPSATAPPQVEEGKTPAVGGAGPSALGSVLDSVLDRDGPDAFEQAMSTLTASQRQAVDSTATALCVIAGAGSGKTRVLTLRAAKRIREGSADADHTAICTFTRKAARELRQRLDHYGVLVSTPSGAGGPPGPGVRAGTLHQLALTLLRRHAQDTGQAPPTVAEHRFRMVTAIVGEPAAASAIDSEIAWAKANSLTPATYGEQAELVGRTCAVPRDRVAAGFEAYEEALRKRRMLDLDDVLIRSANLIHDDVGFAERTHWRYRHLSVDEFQDVNPAQFRLITALTGARVDLCAVGDPNQAIYGWNGADHRLLHRLPELVPGMEVLRLGENHRSTSQVVAAAGAALGPSLTAPPRAAGGDGPMPVVTAYDDEVAEAEGVAALLLDRSASGMRWSDQAVLARTHDQLAVVRQALTRAGIPHRVAPGAEAPPAGGSRPGASATARPQPGSNPISSDRGRQHDDAVDLATFHRAKGLEWTSVSVVGIEDGYVPIIYAESSAAREEERRLLYVALTRASRELHCSWARSRTMGAGRTVERQPSPWLAAVARVSRTGIHRVAPRDAAQRFAAMRADLGTR